MRGSPKPIRMAVAGAAESAGTIVAGMIGVLTVALAAAGCGAGQGDGPVPTGLLLAVQLAPGAAPPDELLISVYGEHGILYVNQRLPATGALVPDDVASGRLGTVAIHLPDGTLRTRLDLRGLSGGVERLRATVGEADVSANRQKAITVTLAATSLPDGDGDGVPDSIDDCPAVADPSQADSNGNGVGNVCESAVDADAGTDRDADVDATDPARDAAPAAEVGSDSARGDGQDDGARTASRDAGAETSAEAAAFDASLPDGRLISDGSAKDALTDASSLASGTLTIAQIPSLSTVNLSAEGTLDWAHWGLTNAQSFDHKASGGGKIGNLTAAPGHQSNNLAVTYVWTEGTPTKSGNTATGVYNTGTGASLSLKVAAGTTTTTLRLYLDANSVNARLTAHLSDGSAPDAVFDTTAVLGSYQVPVEITFRSRTAAQTLTVTWAETSLAVVNAIAIRAATLF